jgi:hypothetical protein
MLDLATSRPNRRLDAGDFPFGWRHVSKVHTRLRTNSRTFCSRITAHPVLAESGFIHFRSSAELLYRAITVSPPNPPLVFLDLDDVLCLNAPYGGHHVFNKPYPADLWEKLFSEEATGTLLKIVHEHRPRVVLTTSWIRRLHKAGFVGLFNMTGLGLIADSLHEKWDAPQNLHQSRLQAIESWLQLFHQGEKFVILDDHLSGSGLAGSKFDKAGRLVLCQVGVGLLECHKDIISSALRT